MLQIIQDFIIAKLGLNYAVSLLISFVTISLVAFILCFIADFIAKTYLVRLLNLIITKAYSKLSSFLKKRTVVTKLSRLAPALVLYLLAPAFQTDDLEFTKPLIFVLKQASLAYMIFTLTRAFLSILDVIEDVYNQYEVSIKRPIKSYLQIAKILFTVVGIVIFVSLLLNKSPLAFFTGLGAAATILVLIFKDSILSFLASVQVASYDMIRIGDWIEMSKYGADGTVSEIALTTVKVRNFDKTVTTIPTSALINEGVKNWRGMQESGGRRIKRSVRVDLNSVKFCDQDVLESVKKIPLFKQTLEQELSGSKELKNLTNAQLFRRYIEAYLTDHKDIYSDQSFTFLIRQLQADQYGVPIELYIFTKTTNWNRYETIQANIFDHLFAVLPFFKLRAYQNITGSDITKKL